MFEDQQKCTSHDEINSKNRKSLMQVWQHKVFESYESFLTYYWCFLVLATKCYLLIHDSFSLYFEHLVWLPIFFLPEACMFAVVLGARRLLSLLPISDARKSSLRLVLISTILIVTCAIYGVVMSSIYRVGFILSWYTFFCGLAVFNSISGAFSTEVVPAIVIAAIYLATIYAGILRVRKERALGLPFVYTPVTKNVSPRSDPESDSDSAVTKARLLRPNVELKGISKIFIGLALVFYIMAGVKYRPADNVDSNVVSDPFLIFFRELADYISHPCVVPRANLEADKQHLEWFKNCQSIDELIKQSRSSEKYCSLDKDYLRDYSFIKRKADSPIKNIVVLYMESARADSVPFNYTSRLAEKLTEQAAKEKNITPFFDELVKKSLYSSNSKSICSYTIKSTVGGMCSIYPMPQNHMLEHQYGPYRPCLPTLLSKYGDYSSAYFQPHILAFDNQRTMGKLMGFDYIYGAEELQAGIDVDPPKEFVNPMGFEDLKIREPMMAWLDKVLEKDKPFLLMYASSVTHADFGTPKAWPLRTYSTSDKIVNQYLNAVSYSDQFFKTLMSDFEERGLMNNTLFVFLGDHGISLGDHGVWIIPGIPYESQFGVPTIIYSANEQWQKHFPARRFHESWHSMDIMPTVLDALRFDGENTEFTGKYLCEGQSVLRDYEQRLQFSMSSPGMSYFVIRENGKKIAFPQTSEKGIEFYDLARDPEEDNKLRLQSLSEEFKQWADSMMFIKTLYINKTVEWYLNHDLLLQVPQGQYV